ncbi:hypothetical protein ACJ73_00622 [Blastomyces percursus]|uniref:Uncharacterized protein n=1 Tax=Blastomyces percursus TaxID=1658174 RepID=A0A1J9RK61_9EURO|nr:hypothetical protein ACJ73_00622 [Blastomyces percursus]
MSKTTKSNGIKAPPSSPLHPQTPPGSRSHANPPQPVTMEQLRELFIDVLRQAKQSSDSSKPIEDTKPETNKNKEGNEGKLEHQSSNIRRSTKSRWDKDNSKYKIVDSVREDKAIDDPDQYIFVVRNQLDRMTKETKTFVDIKSEALLDVLLEIVRDVRAISLREDKPSIERNFLYNFLPDLEKCIIKKRWDHADPRSKHVDLLIGYIKETYASTTQSLSPLLKKG